MVMALTGGQGHENECVMRLDDNDSEPQRGVHADQCEKSSLVSPSDLVGHAPIAGPLVERAIEFRYASALLESISVLL